MSQRLNRRLASAIPWTVFDAVFNAFYALCMVLLIGRFISPAELGVATTALAIVQLVEATYLNGIYEAVVRSPSGHTTLTDTANSLNVGLSVIGVLVCLSIALLVDQFIASERILALTALASVALPLNAFASVPSALFARKMRTAALTRRITFGKICGIIALVSCALAGMGAPSVIFSALASSGVSLLLVLFPSKRWPRFRMWRSEFTAIVSYAGASSAEYFTWMATTRIFLILFGMFHGFTALGHLQFAMRLVDELSALLQTAVTRLGLPYFSGLMRTGQNMSDAYRIGAQMLNLVGAPTFGLLAVVAADLIPTLFGHQWEASIPYIWILSVAWVVAFTMVLMPSVMKARGESQILLGFSLFKAICILAGCWGTASFDPIWGVLVWGGVQFIALPWASYLVRSRVGISYRQQILMALPALAGASVLAISVTAASTLFALSNAYIKITLLVAIGALAYVLSLLLYGRKDVLFILSRISPGLISRRLV